MVKKKAPMIPLNDRKKMIDKVNLDLTIEDQCKLLGISRSTFRRRCKTFCACCEHFRTA